jgi:hypothetical protein
MMMPNTPLPALVNLALSPLQAQQAQWQQAIAALVAPYSASLSPAKGVLPVQVLATEALSHAPLFWVAAEAASLSTAPEVWAASYLAVDLCYPGVALLHGVSKAMPNSTRPYKHPQRAALGAVVLQAARHPALGLRLLLVEMDDPQGAKKNIGALGFCRQHGFQPLHRLALPQGLAHPQPLEGCVLWGLVLGNK